MKHKKEPVMEIFIEMDPDGIVEFASELGYDG